MFFPTALCLLPLLLSVSLASPAALDKRLTRSKIEQFSNNYCGTSGNGKLDQDVNMDDGDCIDIDGRTHSVWLTRGTGLVWRRRMAAYSQTGCPANKKIQWITERDPTGPCVPIDTALLGVPGSDDNQGRIMSVKFTRF